MSWSALHLSKTLTSQLSFFPRCTFRLGMSIGPVGMNTYGFRTRWTWIRVGKLTRGFYRVRYSKYIG
jgi:hypothetical protein